MKKVLIIGNEPSDFVLPLLSDLINDHNIKIGLFELRKLKPKQKEIDKLDIEDIKLPDKPQPIIILKIFLSKFFYIELFKSFNLRESLRTANFYLQCDKFFKYDTYNFHMVNFASLYYLKFVPKNKRVVLSFWGSDLLSTLDRSKAAVEKAVIRANAITINTVELREIILAKYGRDLYSKIKVAFLFDHADHFNPILEKLSNKQEIISGFKKAHGIEQDKKIVVIGHSGHHIDNHLVILTEMAKLEKNFKENICVVLPMTYGCKDQRYLQDIRNFCDKNDLNHRVLNQYLSHDDIINLRIASEIHIRLPKYDSFSLSLCETICSNNIIITGLWLPYGKFKLNGVYHREIEFYEDLNKILKTCLLDFDNEIKQYSNNNKAIIELFKKADSSNKFNKILTE